MEKVYLALPCFNPTELQWSRIGDFCKSLKGYSSLGLEFHVAVIDDGSPFWEPPPPQLKNEISFVKLGVNVGKGAALRTALNNIETDYSIFAFIDFDLPYATEDLVRACLSVKAGADIAAGDRSCWWQAADSEKLSRNIAHLIFRFVIRTLVIGGLHDTQCGVKAFKFKAAKLIAQKSKLNGFLFDVEWLYIAARHRLSIQNLTVRSQAHHSSNNFLSFINGTLIYEFGKLITTILKRSYDSRALIEWKKSQLPL